MRRLAGLLTGVEHAVGVAAVVVDDRLLLDGHRRHVRERGARAVGAVPVVEERQRGVAVVDDGRLDALGRRPRCVGLSRSSSGEVRPSCRWRRSPGRSAPTARWWRSSGWSCRAGTGPTRDGRTPPSPAGSVARRRMSAQPIGLSRVAEGLGHRLRHGDDERREHERLGRRSTIAGLPWSARRWLRIAPQRSTAGDQITGAALRDAARPSRWRAAWWPRRTPCSAVGRRRNLAVELGLVGRVERLGQGGHQVDLLRRHRHVDDRAVARVAQAAGRAPSSFDDEVDDLLLLVHELTTRPSTITETAASPTGPPAGSRAHRITFWRTA